MPEIPQIRRLLFNDEEIGMGFNSESGLAVGTPLQGFTIADNPAAPGGEVIADVSIMNTHEELQKSLGMSFEAQGRYGFISSSGKARFSESTKFNSTSTFLIARCIVNNSLRRGKNFQTTAEAQQLLTANRLEEFTKAFGDSFIRGLQTGGEFYAVIRITSVSTSTQAELAATLQGEINGLVGGGSFKGAYQEANSESRTRSEFTASMYQRAGFGAQLTPTVTIEDVISRYKSFPEIARSSAAAYQVEVATYDTLPLPIPSAEERDDFLIALSDSREKKLRYIQTRNDLEFALQNPVFFHEVPSVEILNGAIVAYTKLINAVMAHAIKLSKGQMDPPRLFDPGALTPPLVEPSATVLRRTFPPGKIRIPDLKGMKGDSIVTAFRLFRTKSIDEIYSLLGHRLSIEQLKFLRSTTQAVQAGAPVDGPLVTLAYNIPNVLSDQLAAYCTSTSGYFPYFATDVDSGSTVFMTFWVDLSL
ncbi:hypothetical protein [Streptomyces sp. A0592]|uniref:hypothetical protein n=1 Tax=Streptomyces sp. A0592 TaxID=2563099 RepID=UPI00109E9B94|nr:hypothetical protein [Streptomyces sp. A0592]THA74892.1 hypothetical protein E6U81_37395 [Streptomyces sp. A0592]